MIHKPTRNLNEWLTYLETAHTNGLIDMGLERITLVKERMQLTPTCPIIIVGGTNGKGSVCAYLSHIYHEAGYTVGTLTSPHLLNFNERITINTVPVGDDEIIQAFEHIDNVRREISLTYFEFNTLAAVDIFIKRQVDIMILEVGLGGRLDAVNIFDGDLSIITSIDLDHQAYLGNTIEQVAWEKAHIMRPQKPVICGQTPAPQKIQQYAQTIQAQLLTLNHDFSIRKQEQQWSFRFHPTQNIHLTHQAKHALPIPSLRGSFQIQNAACALTAIVCLNDKLPVDIGAIKRGLVRVRNPGRFQVLPGRPVRVLDVGHNPHAAKALRSSLLQLPYAERRIAVFSMLADKDIDAVLHILKDQFDVWMIAPLTVPRAASIEMLQEKLAQHHIDEVNIHNNIANAWKTALSQASENDRIVAFGSFHTIAEILALPQL